MGFISTVLGLFGFGVGFLIGIVVGYYMFIFFQPTDAESPEIRPLAEQSSEALQKLLPEIPIWIKNPDYDRIDWLNRFVELMWPYLDKAICKQVQEIAAPIIAEEIPKYKIDAVEFEELSLGTLPPTFQGMKIYSTEEKELIMELGVKFAGNPNILVAAKAFGLKATVQVIEVLAFACPRITLKPLVPVFPCFANIHVSLMEKPFVDFGVKLMGIDAMSIPGLYRFVQEIVKDQVAAMYLWPKRLEVPIMDPIKALARPLGILNVHVLRAMKLAKKDINGKSDPYVKIRMKGDKQPGKKTTIKHKNLNPEWNEEFSFSVKDLETQVLKLKVVDYDQVGSHETIGSAIIELKELTPEEPKTFELNLLETLDTNDRHYSTKSQGHLVVECTYKPFTDNEMGVNLEAGEVQKAPEGTPESGGMLVIIVHDAQDLEGKHHTNPSARIHFRGEARKTKTIKKNRDPRWEEEFEFVLDEPPVNDKIHVEVVSSSKKLGLRHPKECLGYVEIQLADVVNNKRINERYHLIDSKAGRINIELQWRTAT